MNTISKQLQWFHGDDTTNLRKDCIKMAKSNFYYDGFTRFIFIDGSTINMMG